jgi:hypothetical protein
MSYINAIIRDASGSVSSTQVPESTLERAKAWASQRFEGCEWKWSATARSVGGQLEGGATIELVRYGGPRPELVVTRLPNIFVDILRERGVIDDTTPVLARASRGEVRGKHMLGLLPNYLSSLAASITEIPMRMSNEDYVAMQRGELTAERARAVIGNPVTYRVERIPPDGVDR